MEIRLWPRLVGDRSRRERWDENLSWFRLRYQERSGPQRCIRLLSSAQVCGRVALYYLPDAVVSRLYVGVPAQQRELLQQMSGDLNFSVTVSSVLRTSPIRPLTPAGQLPWSRAFLAHVVEGQLFVDETEEKKSVGRSMYLPPAQKGKEALDKWRLLQPPPVGLSTQPSWNGHRPLEALPTSPANMSGWPLARPPDGAPLFAGTRVNLYGSGGAVESWLVRLVEHLLRDEPRGLIVIDARGDLVPGLKRKTAVTRLLGKQLTYVDVDGAVVAGGFNPLAPVPGESEAESLRRWQRWFSGMGVHKEGVQLLGRTTGEGVTDIASLQRWLRQPAQQYYAAAVSSLQSALRKLQADPALREWLSWPTNVFEKMPEGVLLLACPGDGWARQQLLVAAALAALSLPEARLVLHGLPWTACGFAPVDFEGVNQLLVSNGPCLKGSTVVLTRSGPGTANKLARRFLGGDVMGEENLQLLEEGRGLVVDGGRATPVQWFSPTIESKKGQAYDKW